LNIVNKKYTEAKQEGAMSLFGEKYGDEVRVVTIGDFSKELCGGGHVERTGQIEEFKIIKEASISSGTRRIEAITGKKNVAAYRQEQNALAQADAEKARQKEEQKKKEKEQLQKVLAHLDTYITQKKMIKNIPAIILDLGEATGEAVRTVADSLANHLKSGVVVLGAHDGGKALILAKVVGVALDAHKIIKAAAPSIEGGGGGKPDLAQAGGKNPSGISAALIKAEECING
jgi:alanyl-tRNA synthetase